MRTKDIAAKNLDSHLKNNAYPGRGLVVGTMDNGEDFAMVYFIMGRSENSRNRRFLSDGDRLWTTAVDESKVTDPSLIIYDAMLALPGKQMVSNGDQTTTIKEGLENGGTFMDSLATREREPDGPNFTPRISGMVDCTGETPEISLSILKANKFNSDNSDRYTFRPSLPEPGTGYGLTTYMGDGSPLPSYSGDPLLLPLSGSAQDILSLYWSALDEDNRVSLAVKTFSKDGSLNQVVIKNRHQ